MEDYIRDEYDEQNLTAEYIIEMLGQEITFYELWEAGEDSFFGKAKVNSLKKDENGQIWILAETVWGSDLNQAYLIDDYFVYGQDQRPIYIGPPPFEIHQIEWHNPDGSAGQKLIIVHEADREFTFNDIVKLVTSQPYTSKRVQ